MSNRNFLRLIVAASLVTVVSLSGFSILYLSPSFTRLIIQNTESEAVKIGRHLSQAFRDMERVARELPDGFVEQAETAVDDFGLMKIKVFAPDGEIVYSTSAKEIGTMNDKDYFESIVARGGVFTKVVHKDTLSLEDQMVQADVVETYVPIMKEGDFIGAFEVYFDITGTRRELGDLLFTSHSLLLLITSGLMLAIFIISLLAGRSFKKQEAAEMKIMRQSDDLREKNNELMKINREKLKLIDELQATIAEIKTLRGIIPICMYCKKIRNDKGVWDQLERYIEKHSEADFSHGCCPGCLEKLQEELNSGTVEKNGGEDPS
jgi:hypothetical protein